MKFIFSIIINLFLLSSFIFFTGCSTKEDPFIKAGKKYNVNHRTLRAIARIESGENPYALNVNTWLFKGSHNFDSWLTANLYMDFVLDPTFQNYDIGICQINTQWLDKFNIDNEDLLDIEININIAAKIYRTNVDSCNGEIYCALSMYNTGKKNSKVGKKYANKVLKARKSL